MDHDFWLSKWETQQIGFHQPDGQPLLHAWWPSLALPSASRVCVPLCGKAVDMHWLAEQGHFVTGIELSAQAAQDFFSEAGLACEVDTHAGLTRYRGGRIEILAGDLFDLPETFFQNFDACYDRAAMIALPPEMRRRYADHLYGNLPAQAQALLICLTYTPGSLDGPPFSVTADNVEQLLPANAQVQQLASQPLPADDPLVAKGADQAANTVYRLQFGAR